MNSELKGDDWEPCPPGMLRRMVRTLRRRRQLHHLQKLAATLAIVAAVGFGLSRFHHPQPKMGELTCSQVADLKADYDAGGLAPLLRERVAEHLANCPNCQRQMEKLQAGQRGVAQALAVLGP